MHIWKRKKEMKFVQRKFDLQNIWLPQLKSLNKSYSCTLRVRFSTYIIFNWQAFTKVYFIHKRSRENPKLLNSTTTCVTKSSTKLSFSNEISPILSITFPRSIWFPLPDKTLKKEELCEMEDQIKMSQAIFYSGENAPSLVRYQR